MLINICTARKPHKFSPLQLIRTNKTELIFLHGQGGGQKSLSSKLVEKNLHREANKIHIILRSDYFRQNQDGNLLAFEHYKNFKNKNNLHYLAFT